MLAAESVSNTAGSQRSKSSRSATSFVTNSSSVTPRSKSRASGNRSSAVGGSLVGGSDLLRNMLAAEFSNTARNSSGSHSKPNNRISAATAANILQRLRATSSISDPDVADAMLHLGYTPLESSGNSTSQNESTNSGSRPSSSARQRISAATAANILQGMRATSSISDPDIANAMLRLRDTAPLKSSGSVGEYRAKNRFRTQPVDAARSEPIPNRPAASRASFRSLPVNLKQTYSTANSKPLAKHPCHGVSNPFDHSCWEKHITGIVRPLLERSKKGDWGCSGDLRLGPHQHVVVESAKLMAAGGPASTNTHRGLLVYQNTGSGKTVTAMGIAAAFWNTATQIYFVTTRDNIRGNPPSKYAENMLLFYPDMVPTVFAGVPLPPRNLWTPGTLTTTYGDNMSVLKWCETVGQSALQKKFKFQSFINFSQAKKTVPLEELKKTGTWVVIIDEAQNLFKFPTDNKTQIEGLKAMQKALTRQEYMKHTFVFPLTATPGQTPQEVLNLINIVRPFNSPPITVQQFVQDPSVIKGMVSYADVRGDKSHYGTITTTGFGKADNVTVPYDHAYFAAYLKLIKGYNDLKTFQEGKGTLFYGRAREASIMLPEKEAAPYFKSLNGQITTFVPGGHRTKYILSTKTVKMMETIKNTAGCQYAYVHSQKVLKALGPAFQKMGFDVVNLSHIDDVSLEKVQSLYGRVAKPRVVLYHPGNMQYPDGSSIEGTNVALPRLKKVLQFFKSKANSKGQYIKAIVGTPFEGLDMSYLRAVHILAPLPTLEDDEQAVGRALRNCGHLPENRTVAVYRYFGVPPKGPLNLAHLSDSKRQVIDRDVAQFLKTHPDGINAHVFEDARRRGMPMKTFMECVKAHSKECQIDTEKGGLLGDIQFGDKIRCGMKRCEVELTKDGGLVIPKAVAHKKKVQDELERRKERNMEIQKSVRKPLELTKEEREMVGTPVKQQTQRLTSPLVRREYTGPYTKSKIYVSPFDRRKYG